MSSPADDPRERPPSVTDRVVAGFQEQPILGAGVVLLALLAVGFLLAGILVLLSSVPALPTLVLIV